MDLRPLILGWLLEGSCHGYELLQRLVPFEPGSTGLNEGRLYKLLGDLEREGLTRHLLVRQKGLPDRKVLRLTPKGKAAFLDWLQNSSAGEGPGKYDFFLRDPFLVRLFFAHHLGRAGERQLIRRHIQEVEARIRDFTRLRKSRAAFPAAPRRMEILVLGLGYLVAKLRWLRRRLVALSVQPPDGNPPGPRAVRPSIRPDGGRLRRGESPRAASDSGMAA